MVSQKDYGTAHDATLVPSALRVFRHFAVDTARGIITPMNYRPPHSDYPYADRTPTYLPGRTTFEAECTRSPFIPRGDHKSPDPNCTCGFYASYKKDVDFYPSTKWGRGYFRASSNHASDSGLANMVIVRAVCEVSGTTVAGWRGVRAQKMEIKALAIDWSKWNSGREYLEDFTYRIWDRDAYPLYSSRVPDMPGTEEYDEVSRTVEMIAGRYGIPFFWEKGEMLGRFEEDDVEALGIDTTPPARPTLDEQLSFYKQMITTTTAAAEAARVAKKAIYEALDTLKGVRVDLVIVDEIFATPKQVKRRGGGSMPQSVADIIEAKQNRSAPPGTGIDRRRGRRR